MENLENFLNKDMVETISNFVELKIDMLKSVPDFKEKDSLFSANMEELDQSLPEDLKEKFDELIRLNYQLEDYYFALAFLLGSKYGDFIGRM